MVNDLTLIHQVHVVRDQGCSIYVPCHGYIVEFTDTGAPLARLLIIKTVVGSRKGEGIIKYVGLDLENPFPCLHLFRIFQLTKKFQGSVIWR